MFIGKLSFVLGIGLAISGFSMLNPATLVAGELRIDESAEAVPNSVNPVTSKTFPFTDQVGDGSDFALFPKSRTVRRAPSLEQETRCSWWLPKDLPLGGGFSYALFCDGTAQSGNWSFSTPLMGES